MKLSNLYVAQLLACTFASYYYAYETNEIIFVSLCFLIQLLGLGSTMIPPQIDTSTWPGLPKWGSKKSKKNKASKNDCQQMLAHVQRNFGSLLTAENMLSMSVECTTLVCFMQSLWFLENTMLSTFWRGIVFLDIFVMFMLSCFSDMFSVNAFFPRRIEHVQTMRGLTFIIFSVLRHFIVTGHNLLVVETTMRLCIDVTCLGILLRQVIHALPKDKSFYQVTSLRMEVLSLYACTLITKRIFSFSDAFTLTILTLSSTFPQSEKQNTQTVLSTYWYSVICFVLILCAYTKYFVLSGFIVVIMSVIRTMSLVVESMMKA